ncbi:hypothetical protein RUND412_004337 [Rhizina undulata]
MESTPNAPKDQDQEPESDPPQPQLESMGFTSFGGQTKRPKHRHDSDEVQVNHPLPPRPAVVSAGGYVAGPDGTVLGAGAEEGFHRHQGGMQGGEYGYHNRTFGAAGDASGKPWGFQNQNRKRGNAHLEGPRNPQWKRLYMPSFVENPWAKFEAELGIGPDD